MAGCAGSTTQSQYAGMPGIFFRGTTSNTGRCASPLHRRSTVASNDSAKPAGSSSFEVLLDEEDKRLRSDEYLPKLRVNCERATFTIP